MNLAVAVLPSNQDLNLGAIEGYSEAGGCRLLSKLIVAEFIRRGVKATYWEALLDSADTAGYAGLSQKMREAAAHLRAQPAGTTVCALHIHTNAGGTPAQGTSHTGYCFGGDPRGEPLGRAAATKVGAVLTLPVVDYDYSGLGYLFATLFPGIPSTILEITRHDREPDLRQLYALTAPVAVAVVDGTLQWAGENVPPAPAPPTPAPPEPVPPEQDTLRKVFDDLWKLSDANHAAIMRAKIIVGGWG